MEVIVILAQASGVLDGSDYFVHTASSAAERTFFYPVCVGYYIYDSSYALDRCSYDSFLIMYIKKGRCFITAGGQTHTAGENQVVILDCYSSHSYCTDTGWEAEFIHYDGIAARAYFQMITESSGPVITLQNTQRFEKFLHLIYQRFKENVPIKEALLSQYITNMLTELLVSGESHCGHPEQANVIEEAAAYINEHLTEHLTLNDLAAGAALSPYYFTRLFKKETGLTPHEYLIAMRIDSAKFLLKSTSASIKEICFLTGFANESNFCTTFKKWVKVTPSAYRRRTNE